MFQPCFSWKIENPCKFFIYKGLSSSSCTQTRIRNNQSGENVGKKKNAEKRRNYTVFQYVIIILNFNPS